MAVAYEGGARPGTGTGGAGAVGTGWGEPQQERERYVRVAFERFPVPPLPLRLMVCPVCRGRTVDIRHCPPMFVSAVTVCTAEQRAYMVWRDTPKRRRQPRTEEQYAKSIGLSRSTIYRWRRTKLQPVPVPESAVISCFSCGRDYLQYEKGAEGGWQKLPVRLSSGEIVNDW
jgi:uncharacterized protein YbaR (Trm112 family)